MAGAQEATQHLLGHGHRSVSLINGPVGTRVAAARREGWLAALDGRRGSSLVAEYTARAGASAMRTLLADDRPTAVLVASDVQAIGAERAILDAGLRCPEDVAVLSFDGTEAAEYAPVPLTCVSQPIGEMAVQAVEHVLERESPPTHLVLEYHLTVRRSCGCAGPS